MCCPTEIHEALKADDAAWQRLSYIGTQDTGPDALELRNCGCGSTLARPQDADLVLVTFAADPFVPETVEHVQSFALGDDDGTLEGFRLVSAPVTAETITIEHCDETLAWLTTAIRDVSLARTKIRYNEAFANPYRVAVCTDAARVYNAMIAARGAK